MGSLDWINSVTVTKDDLLVTAEDVAEHHDDKDAGFETVMYCIAQRYKGEPRKAGAVLTRMQALARYVGAIHPRGWTLPKDADGSIPTQEAVFGAAAVHPLTLVGNQLEFERASFEAKILEVADIEGRA
jgi:hypothetical protein